MSVWRGKNIMSIKTIPGSIKLGETIKNRRQELGLTIEEAATKAGVGTKSWCRYESGQSIRSDKVKGICKVLNWLTLLGESGKEELSFDINEYRNHTAWSPYLCEQFGEITAIAFAAGSDIILDYIEDDLRELATMPKGSHIGQIPISMIKDSLPQQFLMRYDYDFLYQLKSTVIRLRITAKNEKRFAAHSVLEELAIYLFMQESAFFLDCISDEIEDAGIDNLDIINDWAFEMFDDMDIVTFLYSDHYLSQESNYHFNHWTIDQFYMS